MKRLLIVVGFQSDHLRRHLPGDAMDRLDAQVAARVRAYRDAGDKVIFVIEHAGPRVGEGAGRVPQAAAQAASGHADTSLTCRVLDLYGQVGDLCQDIDEVFQGGECGSKDLFLRLVKAQKVAASMGVEPFGGIEVAGALTDRAVLAQVMIARCACPAVPVVVHASAVASSEASRSTAALGMIGGLGVQVICDDAGQIAGVSGGAGTPSGSVVAASLGGLLGEAEAAGGEASRAAGSADGGTLLDSPSDASGAPIDDFPAEAEIVARSHARG
ncbi:hypothetical protein HLV37_03070 [Eggerthellaceae bacterium zg-1084]|uniref:hypothetical protein n=1 Tax=Berryella wangjianweii TaxID=2734634 RepID=UPI001553AD48|nr:hypothetical protein [Berryella wangjianweii]NPD30860.1 hypothetical protein [Berryella wangjianweii]